MGSVTHKIENIRTAAHTGGIDSGAEELINTRFFPQIEAYAARLGGDLPVGAFDPADAANSALRRYLTNARAGGLADVKNRNGLLAFLLNRVRDRVVDQRRAHHAQKRGEGQVLDEGSVLKRDGSGEMINALEPVNADNTPEQELLLTDTLERATSLLSEPCQRAAALFLAGFSDDEVGRQLKKSLRTLRTYKQAIKARWLEALRVDRACSHPRRGRPAGPFHLLMATAAVTDVSETRVLEDALQLYIAQLAPAAQADIKSLTALAQDACAVCGDQEGGTRTA